MAYWNTLTRSENIIALARSKKNIRELLRRHGVDFDERYVRD
jgi:hypothetical protein